MKRFSWDKYFMLQAKIASLRSGCNSRPTGAVIVLNKRVVATGYNGTLSGQPQCTDFGEDYCFRRSKGIQDLGEEKYRDCPSIHAEANALDQLLKYGPCISEGAIIYCTLFPCIHCLKRIVSAGIKKAFYELDYESDDIKRDNSWRRRADEWGIETIQLVLSPVDDYNEIYDRVFSITSERRLK